MSRYLVIQTKADHIKKEILKQVDLQRSYWKEYMLNEPSLDKIMAISDKIQAKRNKIEHLWNDFEQEDAKGFVSPYMIQSVYIEIVNHRPASSLKFVNQKL